MTSSVAITDGIRVSVTSRYLPAQSSPRSRRYSFAYHINISNESSKTVQLHERHWVITDAESKVQEVNGAGVVGVQPVLRPGENFSYTSGCILETPRGVMHGSYGMQADDNKKIQVEIAPFALELPTDLN